jgi:membrane protein
LGVLKRTFSEFRDDNVTDWAAALTYYGVLAIFPAIIALVSILGLVGHSATQPLIDNLSKIAPGPAQKIFTSAITNLQHSRGAAGILFIAGILGAIWSASGYIAAFMRASNGIYEVEEGRPFWKLKPLQLAVTFVLIMLAALVALGLVLSGPIVHALGSALGISGGVLTAWRFAKWPAMLLLVLVIFCTLYYTAPNARVTGVRWVTGGAVLAIAVWIFASIVLAIYVANFGSYNKTYGTLAGVVVFLLWLWITNMAILLGAEFNAETERAKQIHAGIPRAEHELQLEAREPVETS